MIISGIEHVEHDCQQGELCVINTGFEAFNKTALNDAVESTVSDGVVVLVPAGKDASNACGYSPSSAGSAITVGSTANPDSDSCRSDQLFPQDVMSGISNYGR